MPRGELLYYLECLLSHPRLRYPEVLVASFILQMGAEMPAAVKIKAGKYGSAIGLLLERGGSFQTRPELTLIVNSDQRKALEEAGLVDVNGIKIESGKKHARKK